MPHGAWYCHTPERQSPVCHVAWMEGLGVPLQGRSPHVPQASLPASCAGWKPAVRGSGLRYWKQDSRRRRGCWIANRPRRQNRAFRRLQNRRTTWGAATGCSSAVVAAGVAVTAAVGAPAGISAAAGVAASAGGRLDRERDRFRIAAAAPVGDGETRGEGPRVRIGVRPDGVAAALAVAESPGVGEAVAVGVRGGAAVKADGQRRCALDGLMTATAAGGLLAGSSGGAARTVMVDTPLLLPPRPSVTVSVAVKLPALP